MTHAHVPTSCWVSQRSMVYGNSKFDWLAILSLIQRTQEHKYDLLVVLCWIFRIYLVGILGSIYNFFNTLNFSSKKLFSNSKKVRNVF